MRIETQRMGVKIRKTRIPRKLQAESDLLEVWINARAVVGNFLKTKGALKFAGQGSYLGKGISRGFLSTKRAPDAAASNQASGISRSSSSAAEGDR